MAQYFPTYQSKKTDLNRKLTIKELEKIENYIQEIGLENGYIQELSEHEEEYVPIWKW
jgi:putative pyruvate formate lyase activating enzyme